MENRFPTYNSKAEYDAEKKFATYPLRSYISFWTGRKDRSSLRWWD